MAISKLKALHVCDPPAAREKIIDAFLAHNGNGRAAAYELDVSYMTLYRMFEADAKLAAMLQNAREQLIEQGVYLNGVGDVQHALMREKANRS